MTMTRLAEFNKPGSKAKSKRGVTPQDSKYNDLRSDIQNTG